MATTFRENTNAATRVESTEYRLVDGGLVHMRRELELRASKVGQILVRYISCEFPIVRDVFSPGKLEKGILYFLFEK